MARGSTSKADQEWEAESDARTLMEYVKLQKDSKRWARAQKALKKMEHEAKEVQLQQKVARGLKRAFTEDD